MCKFFLSTFFLLLLFYFIGVDTAYSVLLLTIFAIVALYLILPTDWSPLSLVTATGTASNKFKAGAL